MKTTSWIKCTDRLPPKDEIVETKIDDAQGVRNVGTLRRMNRLWFVADKSVYVYYTPTHWRPILK